MPVKKDLSGQKFGRLTVIKKDGLIGLNIAWLCECSCGNTKRVNGKNLRSGRTKSCGCLNLQNKTKHGMYGTITYKSWEAMKQRCNNPKHKFYKYYGGRGIKVCERWLTSFEYFYADMGDRPSRKHSIDRIDVNGNYEPNNCRWATAKQQANNRR